MNGELTTMIDGFVGAALPSRLPTMLSEELPPVHSLALALALALELALAPRILASPTAATASTSARGDPAADAG